MRPLSFCIIVLAGCSSPAPTRPLPRDNAPAATQPATAPPAKNDWKEYTSKDHGFSILFPGKVTAEKDGEGFLYDGGTESEAYLVRIDTMENEVQNVNETLDFFRDRSVKARKGKLLSETKVTLAGNPGRDIVVEQPNGFARIRGFIVHRRFVFQLSVAGNNKEDVTGKDADKFLGSFKLTE